MKLTSKKLIQIIKEELKKVMTESMEWKNGGIQGDGWYSSLPGEYDNQRMLFSNGSENASVFERSDGEIYADINNRYDKVFDNGRDFVDWLNVNGFEYIGFD